MKADLIGVVQAVYAEARDDGAWLRSIVDAAVPLIDVGLGSVGQLFQTDSKSGVSVTEEIPTGPYGSKLAACCASMQAEAGAKALPFCSQVSLMTELFVPPYADLDFVARHLRPLGDMGGAKDVIGVVGADSSGRGVALGTLIPGEWRMTTAFRRRWQHMVAHLATGLRLRTRSGSSTDEAVLDAEGKLYDATGTATSRDAQLALRQAARAIDRARVRRSRHPDEALEAWRALVGARWSLVDRFESDGRTFLIAKPNPPRPPPIQHLTARERAVVALAALGRSNKLIAYEFGLSVGTVGNYLARAQQKLRVSSRAELIRLFHAAALGGALRRHHESRDHLAIAGCVALRG